jgi:hypothetical protein
MALAAGWTWRTTLGIHLIFAFVLIRTAFLTQLQTCEPRYVLECFPALLAVGAQLGRWPKLSIGPSPSVQTRRKAVTA